jgi:large subunit ribosomal protein L32e
MKMVEKKNKPRFNLSNTGLRKSRLKNRGHRWRRPRADSNKKKMKFAFAGASPRVGYKNPAEIRGLHPSGFPEVLVYREDDLVGLENQVVRIASCVGARRAAKIEEAAKAAKLRVLNPRRKKKATKKEAEEQVSKAGSKASEKETKPAKAASKPQAKKAESKPENTGDKK